MVDRRRNSTLKLYCLSLHCLTRAQSAPQSLQRARAVFTPNPQPIQGIVPPPFAILALWVLQYFPIQLLPHTSVFPNNSHSQLFVPLMFNLVYILKRFYLNTDIFYCKATLVHVCRPDVYMQNWGNCACRSGVFFVHAELGSECMKMWYVFRLLVQNPPAPDVYMQNCRVYEKSDLRTCRIGVILHVGQACFPYMQSWGNCACRCGMFFVQGGPEPAFCILLHTLKF